MISLPNYKVTEPKYFQELNTAFKIVKQCNDSVSF